MMLIVERSLGKIFLALVLLIGGCASTTEILPGLCYSEKDRTHLCKVEPEVQECIQNDECKYA